MKLRNKKTGEIVETHLLVVQSVEDPTKRYYTGSIKDLCDNYEDYKPSEPLIKDEKKLNAVKSFFALLGVTKGIFYQSINNCFYYTDDDGISYGIDFDNIRGIEDIFTHIEYTIAELCGEEEE